MAYAILRTAKITSRQSLAASSSHTLRERPTPNANPMLLASNTKTYTKTDELLKKLDERLEGVRIRKNNVLAIEYLVTASPEAFQTGGQLDSKVKQDNYFQKALNWIIQRHGSKNIIGAAIHRDETSPHLVAYAVPRVEVPEQVRKINVPAGNGDRKVVETNIGAHFNLNARKWLGGRLKLSEMQTNFFDTVGRLYKLERGIEGSRAVHTSVKEWYALMRQAESTPNPSLPSLLEVAVKGTAHPLLQGAKLIRAQAELDKRQAQVAAKRLKSSEDAHKRKVAMISIEQQKLKRKELELQKRTLDNESVERRLSEQGKLIAEMEVEIEERNQLISRLKHQLKDQISLKKS